MLIEEHLTELIKVDIGKKTVIKVLQMMPVQYLLDPEASTEDVLEKATQFMGLCYGIESGSTMSEKR